MFEQNRNAQLSIVTTAAILLGTFDTAANSVKAMAQNAIPGTTAFGWDPQMDVQLRGFGQFGANKPVGITDVYKGIKGNWDVEGTDGEAAALAMLNKIAVASFVNGNDNKLHEFFAICNVTDDDGQALRAHFCDTCKLDAVPKSVGGEAKRFSFQGIIGREFIGKKIKYSVFNGSETPVTSLTLPTGDTAVTWTDEFGNSRYAMLVLRYDGTSNGNKRLELATAAADGFYAETSGAITLHSSNQLATGDKCIVVYLV